jgi:anti-sigma B factor antagonist
MPQFDLSTTVAGESAVLALSGEVDVAAGPAVREGLLKLTSSGVRHVVVDLRQVDFLDSVGLGVLVAASRRLRDAEHPGSLRLVCTNQRVIRLFAVTGLLGLFPVHASVEQARAADGHPAGPSSDDSGGEHAASAGPLVRDAGQRWSTAALTGRASWPRRAAGRVGGRGRRRAAFPATPAGRHPAAAGPTRPTNARISSRPRPCSASDCGALPAGRPPHTVLALPGPTSTTCKTQRWPLSCKRTSHCVAGAACCSTLSTPRSGRPRRRWCTPRRRQAWPAPRGRRGG